MSFTWGDLWYAAILSATLVSVLLLATSIYYSFILPARKRKKVSRRVLEETESLRRIQILKEKQSHDKGWLGALLTGLLGPKRMDKLYGLPHVIRS